MFDVISNKTIDVLTKTTRVIRWKYELLWPCKIVGLLLDSLWPILPPFERFLCFQKIKLLYFFLALRQSV